MIEIILYILLFLGGIAILVFSVESFVENLVKAASSFGISIFLLAVIFAGMDFENWGFGISAVLKNVPDIALGSAIGSAMFLIGGAVVVGAFMTPFESESPRDYLSLMVLSPIALLIFLFDGTLSRIDGMLLLIIFSIFLIYIARKEISEEKSYMRDEEAEEASEELEKEERKNWNYPILMIIFLGGIIIGSELSVRGAREIVKTTGLTGTIFGMTIVGLVMSLEEILLVVEPVREDEINVATGNIVGSLIFFSLGNIGLLAVIKGFIVTSNVISFYWPFFFVSVILVGVFLFRGKIGRKEGAVLASVYAMYWILSYTYL